MDMDMFLAAMSQISTLFKEQDASKNQQIAEISSKMLVQQSQMSSLETRSTQLKEQFAVTLQIAKVALCWMNYKIVSASYI